MEKVKICTKEKHKNGYQFSVPLPFPQEALFDIPVDILMKSIKAERLLGKLDGITLTLPAIDFFLKMFAFKDATSSSQIEGTRATMHDALEMAAEIDTKQSDAFDIIFYNRALNYGIQRLKKFPISLRFIREIHKQLMDGARATHFASPGEFRTSQNWIGGTSPGNASFVPVSPEKLHEALGNLEVFLHNIETFPLVSVAYTHAQFETIHPFLDGNGRVGRLLITFSLMQKGILEKPVLFLSTYFKKHQKIYYEKLNDYHEGNVFSWLEFFLDGVIETANEAIIIAGEVREIRDKDMEKIQALSKRESESSLKVLNYLFKNPIVSTKNIMLASGFSRSGAHKVLDRFIDMGILVEQKQEANYDKKYIYEKYFNAFM